MQMLKEQKGGFKLLDIILKNGQKWSNSFSVVYHLNCIILSTFSLFSLVMPITGSVLSWKPEHKTYFLGLWLWGKLKFNQNLHNCLWTFRGEPMPYVYIYRRDVVQICILCTLTVPSPPKNNLGFLYCYTLVGIFYYDLKSYEMY